VSHSGRPSASLSRHGSAAADEATRSETIGSQWTRRTIGPSGTLFPELIARGTTLARIRLQIYLGGAQHKIGPGKIRLLEEVVEHGSISAAARSMKMDLTRFGERLIHRYHRMERATRRAVRRDLASLDCHLASG